MSWWSDSGRKNWWSSDDFFDEYEGCDRCNFSKHPSKKTCDGCNTGDRYNYLYWESDEDGTKRTSDELTY